MLIGYCDYDSTMAKWSQQPICSHNIDTFTITNCHFVPLNANPNRHSTLLDEIYLQIRQPNYSSALWEIQTSLILWDRQTQKSAHLLFLCKLGGERRTSDKSWHPRSLDSFPSTKNHDRKSHRPIDLISTTHCHLSLRSSWTLAHICLAS